MTPAATRIARYLAMRAVMPVTADGGTIDHVHRGTRWEAVLTLEDLRALAADHAETRQEVARLREALDAIGSMAGAAMARAVAEDNPITEGRRA